MYICNNCGQDTVDYSEKCLFCKSNDISYTKWGFTDEREDLDGREFDYETDVTD